MTRRRSAVLFATWVFAIVSFLSLRASAAPDIAGVRLTIDSSEAEQVLRIVRKRATSAPVPEED